MPRYRNGISPKQERFIEEYLRNGGDAKQAVIAAGYKCKNGNVAKVIGTDNLTKAAIIQPLALRKAEIAAKTGITVEQQQRELYADIQAAKDAGCWGAVMTGRGLLLKSIGGMVGDRPHPDAIKAQDASKTALLLAIADEYMARQYLARPVVSTCRDAVECPPEAAIGPTIDDQAGIGPVIGGAAGQGQQGERQNSPEAPPLPPSPPRPETTTPSLHNAVDF